MEPEILSGGSTNLVEKIGKVVHRKVKGHPMLHEYLLFLEKEGMPGVPRFLGLDEQGREMLTYLPGKTMGPDYPYDHPCLHSDQTLCDMARFMRKLHDISAGFLPRAIEGGWTNPYFPKGEHETICHSDAAIWNFVFVNDRVSGLFDFDQAYPGTRCWDLTSTLFSSALPLYNGYESSKHAPETRRRIKLFFGAYGMECSSDIMALIIDFLQRNVCDGLITGAANGDEACIMQVERGDLTHYQNWVSHLKAHGHEWV